jgi:hypothetical protein
MTQSPARAGVPPDDLELLGEKGSAERALTAALASFQEKVQAVPSLDLAAVVDAARPAFSSGIAFSAQLVEIRDRHKLRVTVMHAGGAEVTSEEWADEVDDLLQAAGWMLAMLLGIPLANQARPSEAPGQPRTEPADVTVAADAAQSSPESHEESAPAADLDVALEPLTPQEIEATHQRILALPQAARQQLTRAFREHFQVPRNTRSIGDRITQHQHAAFIDHFLEECDEQGLDSAAAPPEP